MATREQILEALAFIVGQALQIAEPPIDEPEPTRWTVRVEQAPGVMSVLHAVAVQDDTPDSLAFIRGGADAPEELEFSPVVAYAVQVKPGAGDDVATCRRERRRQRDAAVRLIADAIAADPTLGLDVETYADVRPPARDDDIAFPQALPSATALIPVRVLYTGVDAAA